MRRLTLLRGINVGGHRRVFMRGLQATFEGLDFGQVQTYILSGNVVFEASAANETALKARRARPTGEDTWEHEGHELYLHAPHGLGQSKLSPAPLRQPAMFRN